jgi:DNA-binding response OmpR family regulator
MNKKIVVVDDNKDILDALELTLSYENYSVHTTSKADEALSYICEIRPDVVLLDVLMSGVDGRDICRKLKQSKELGNIPVIMISAHPSAEESVKKVGADDFLAKPFDIDILLERVSKLSN